MNYQDRCGGKPGPVFVTEPSLPPLEELQEALRRIRGPQRVMEDGL